MRRQARTSSPSTAARAASTASIVPSRVSPLNAGSGAASPKPRVPSESSTVTSAASTTSVAPPAMPKVWISGDVERRGGGQALDRGRGRHRRDPITRRLR